MSRSVWAEDQWGVGAQPSTASCRSSPAWVVGTALFCDANELLNVLRDRAVREDPAITGFNVGSNCGASAGQRVQHAHIHFIPRRVGDGPAGRGVKGVIRNKIEY